MFGIATRVSSRQTAVSVAPACASVTAAAVARATGPSWRDARRTLSSSSSSSSSASSSAASNGRDEPHAAPSGGAPETTHFGFEDVPVDQKKGRVGEVFSSVADSYDVMNTAMSGGLHHVWKQCFVSRLRPGPADRIIDVAGGTGDIAFQMADAMSAAAAKASTPLTGGITVTDINQDMLNVGEDRARSRRSNVPLTWVCDDAEVLGEQADNFFDAYTISFGIRNCTDIPAVLRTAHRVLKPGGRFMCLEFSHVSNPVLAQLYDAYSFNVIPAMGGLIAGDTASYQYLVESIRQFPDQDTFAAMIREAGFSAVTHEDMTAGVVALHSGFKLE